LLQKLVRIPSVNPAGDPGTPHTGERRIALFLKNHLLGMGAKVEMQVDEIKPGWNVMIHDDLLATGGTAEAAAKLIQMQNGTVAGFAFVVELEFLKGKERLSQYSENIISLVNY